MQHQILIHLLIIGKDPFSGDFSVGLVNADKPHTVQAELVNNPDVEITNLAKKHIAAPLDWYGVFKISFRTSDKPIIHLIYRATIPPNIRLRDGIKWYSMQDVFKQNIDEIEQHIILDGVRS